MCFSEIPSIIIGTGRRFACGIHAFACAQSSQLRFVSVVVELEGNSFSLLQCVLLTLQSANFVGVHNILLLGVLLLSTGSRSCTDELLAEA